MGARTGRFPVVNSMVIDSFDHRPQLNPEMAPFPDV